MDPSGVGAQHLCPSVHLHRTVLAADHRFRSGRHDAAGGDHDRLPRGQRTRDRAPRQGLSDDGPGAGPGNGPAVHRRGVERGKVAQGHQVLGQDQPVAGGQDVADGSQRSDLVGQCRPRVIPPRLDEGHRTWPACRVDVVTSLACGPAPGQLADPGGSVGGIRPCGHGRAEQVGGHRGSWAIHAVGRIARDVQDRVDVQGDVHAQRLAHRIDPFLHVRALLLRRADARRGQLLLECPRQPVRLRAPAIPSRAAPTGGPGTGRSASDPSPASAPRSACVR